MSFVASEAAASVTGQRIVVDGGRALAGLMRPRRRPAGRLSAALGLPAGARGTCSYDAATATVQAQMLSARIVVANAGDGRILVDGRVCGTLAQTRQIVVASAFPPAADTVVVDERHGRLADPATGRRPKLFALTGAGGDTMEVIGTPGRDRYVAHDDLGASIDLDADGDPDFVSTDVGRVVLRGDGGRRRPLGPALRPRPPGLRARLRHRPRPIRRHRHRMRALAAQEAPMTYLVVGLDQSTFAPWHRTSARPTSRPPSRSPSPARRRAGSSS